LHIIQKARGYYLAGSPIKIIADNGSRLQIHQEGVKIGALFVTKDFIRNFFNTVVEE
jgi:hypothetical protein